MTDRYQNAGISPDHKTNFLSGPPVPTRESLIESLKLDPANPLVAEKLDKYERIRASARIPSFLHVIADRMFAPFKLQENPNLNGTIEIERQE